ncbi:hypothetical protein AS9A_0057 [Hoyosella subflava DQS3-9A1]|uniref:Uncharacterized protein n=1 Tax=Hoyosella subflava (strain DSM 45089 / JCM 17490 / NBRC 109087 / DQS3-9A1) TaxID=443218 RepID=F6ERJ7_HOYSD|nr:hypothetical protein AS9A_0057 [Hoyosella subflava DQS3-9A1]
MAMAGSAIPAETASAAATVSARTRRDGVTGIACFLLREGGEGACGCGMGRNG